MQPYFRCRNRVRKRSGRLEQGAKATRDVLTFVKVRQHRSQARDTEDGNPNSAKSMGETRSVAPTAVKRLLTQEPNQENDSGNLRQAGNFSRLSSSMSVRQPFKGGGGNGLAEKRREQCRTEARQAWARSGSP